MTIQFADTHIIFALDCVFDFAFRSTPTSAAAYKAKGRPAAFYFATADLLAA